MAVDRIDKVLKIENTGRFIIVFGSILEESFVGNDLELYSKEEILHRYAKMKGFKRVIFFDGVNNLHTYDIESVQLTDPNYLQNINNKSKTNEPQPLSPNNPTPSAGRNGRPLGGRRKILGNRNRTIESNHRAGEYSRNNRGYYKIPSGNGKFIVDEIDGYIRDEKIKTAIFIKFSGLPGHLRKSPDGLAHFFTTLEGWGSLRQSNLNKCFLISSNSTSANLEEETRPYSTLKSILNQNSEKGGPQTLLHIAHPHQDELKRLIQRNRITKGLSIEWGQLNSVVRIMDQELKGISFWFHKINELDKLNKKSLKIIVSDKADLDDRDPIEKLESLIGLNGVKQEVKSQLALVKAAKNNPALLKDVRLHLTFEGNPGTGKTTIARLVAQIYREAGVLRRGHLVEADKESLEAGYTGQTAIKTKELIDSAMGGVFREYI